MPGGQLLFVQPLYAWRTDGATLLARGRNARIRSSPRRARSRTHSVRAARQPSATSPIGAADFRTQAEQLYATHADALKRGDWVAFGRAYDALGALLNRSQEMTTNQSRETAVIALGGNALSPAGEHCSIGDQFAHTRESLGAIVDLALDGWDLCLVHGNGPQVGDELVRNELARARGRAACRSACSSRRPRGGSAT